MRSGTARTGHRRTRTYTDAKASDNWAAAEITWGVFGVPESSLGSLGDVAGLDVIELGCGTAYVSAWLARRGARPVGVDVTPAQLATARRCQAEFGIEFPLIEASAEDVPLPSESFDLAVSEYGASIWCDPHLWIPEAYRLLRPGGRLWFLRNSTIAILCAPDDDGKPTDQLRRPQRGLGRLEWPDELGVEWQLPHGELFRLLRQTGFEVVDLVELYAPDDADRPSALRGVLGRVGTQVARRGDLGREEGTMTETLTLASTSPQRRAILEQLRIPFTAVAPSYVEHDPPDADPVDARARSRRRQGSIGACGGPGHARRRHDRPSRRPPLRQGCRPRRRPCHAPRARRPHASRALRASASSATASPLSSTRRPT